MKNREKYSENSLQKFKSSHRATSCIHNSYERMTRNDKIEKSKKKLIVIDWFFRVFFNPL